MNWKNCPFYDIFYELRMSSAQWVKRTSEIPFITYHCGHIFANGTDRLGDKRKKEKLNVSHWGICEQGPPTVSRIKLHPHTMFVTSLGDYPTQKREKSMLSITTIKQQLCFIDYGNFWNWVLFRCTSIVSKSQVNSMTRSREGFSQPVILYLLGLFWVWSKV